MHDWASTSNARHSNITALSDLRKLLSPKTTELCTAHRTTILESNLSAISKCGKNTT
jgi:hypothetical protein